MVFQSYALWPHMTRARNIGYGLRLRGVPRDEIRKRVGTILALLEPGRAGRPQGHRPLGRPAPARRARPGARGRARLLLLDEPLSNLDAKVRLQLRHEIKALQSGSASPRCMSRTTARRP